MLCNVVHKRVDTLFNLRMMHTHVLGPEKGGSGIHEEQAFTDRKRERHTEARDGKSSVSVRNKTHVQRKEPIHRKRIPAQTSNETERGWTWDSMGP